MPTIGAVPGVSRSPLVASHIESGGLAVARFAVARCIGVLGPNQQIVEAVPVHVPRTAHRAAGPVIERRAVKAEAVVAVQGAELEAGGKALVRAEHHIAGAGCAAVWAGALTLPIYRKTNGP